MSVGSDLKGVPLSASHCFARSLLRVLAKLPGQVMGNLLRLMGEEWVNVLKCNNALEANTAKCSLGTHMKK